MVEEKEEPLLFQHKAKNGDILTFDISRAACDKFGFYYTDRVETPLGIASVVGVRDGCLWFLVDGDSGASFWDNGKSYVDLLSIGVSLIPSQDKPAPDKKGYKVKTIPYKNKNIHVVLQNENGPCPLIGIANVLALRGDIVIEGEGTNKNVVTFEGLLDKLSAYLFQANIDKGDEALAKVEKATKIMPQLQYGLDVNFNFKEFDNFEKTEQCKLFELFDIRLVHGWLVDPEDAQTKNAIGDNTYNDLMNKLVALDPASQVVSQPPQPTTQPTSPSTAQPMEMQTPPTTTSEDPASQKKPEEPPKPPTEQDYREGAIINAFLNSTQSQLTAHGLEVLHKFIKEGELCVFFRNNHFSTLTKQEGRLYILVTDIGYERERNIVWDLLANVDGSSIFCTGDFKGSDQENREEVVNTLELMGFSKTQIDDCLPQIPPAEMSNSEAAIQRALSILNKTGKMPSSESEVQVL